MFEGYFVAIVTPLKGGILDFDAYQRALDWVIDNGVHGIVVCGTTGEALTLMPEERASMVEFTVSYVNKRVPIVAGVGSPSTYETLAQMELVQRYDIDGIMAQCPYYIKPTQDGLFMHFKAVAENTNLPVILYNNPGRAAVDLGITTLEKLMVFNNIVALKEASSDLSRVTILKQKLRPGFSIMAGNDDTAAGALAMGASGVVSVTANVAPKYCVEMYNYFVSQNYTAFEKRRDRLMQLHKALFVEPNPIPVKYALSLLGLIKNELRSPLTPLSEYNKNTVRCAMQNLGLII